MSSFNTYLYFHFSLVDSKSINNTLKIFINLNSNLKELLSEAKKSLNSSSNNVKFDILFASKNLNSKPLKDDVKASVFFQNADDIFCKIKIDTVVPVNEEKEKEKETKLNSNTNTNNNNNTSTSKTSNINDKLENLNVKDKKIEDDLTFKPLSKYSFYDDGSFVKVIVPISGVNSIPRENITSDFQEWSFVVKIVGLNNSNFRFGVTRLHYSIVPSESKIIVKANDIHIKLKKSKKDDHLTFLHKTRMIGDGM